MTFSFKKLHRHFLFFVVVCFVLFTWARFVEPNVIKKEEVFVGLEGFPAPELKVVHLTDLHTLRYGEKERKVVEAVDEIDPDLLFITGDLVDWKTTEFEECSRFWKDLVRGREGRVFAVWGNHEHRNSRLNTIEKRMVESGIRVLINENTSIGWGQGQFFLIGVDDPRSGFDDPDRALRGLAPEKTRIMLAHSPEIFRRVKHHDLDLILAGHTHGCQINIPIICDWVIPLAYDKRFKQGLFEEDDTYIYVSRGVGETFLPFRFNCFPEISIIHLYPK